MRKPIPNLEERNNCFWNVLNPYWSTSLSIREQGPQGVSALDVYVEPPDGNPLEALVRIMRPGRSVEKAVVVGQAGVGKSMALAHVAQDLGQDHLLFWIDVVGEGIEVLKDPIELLAAIGFAVYEGARQAGYDPDRTLLERFVDSCFDTVTHEVLDRTKFKVKLEQMLKDVAEVVKRLSWPAALFTGNPGFIVAGGVATGVRAFLNWIEWSAQEQTSFQRTRVEQPQTALVSSNLTIFLQDVERRSGRSILVIIDGLDRVPVEEIRPLFRRARDLARPDVRLILTAPLILYATPDFRQLADFFPHVLPVANARLNDGSNRGEQFLQAVIAKRLDLCGMKAEKLFDADSLARLITASGGNVRQLLRMTREAMDEAESYGDTMVKPDAVQKAILSAMGDLKLRLRVDGRDALLAFAAASEIRVPPGGLVGDDLLDQGFLLFYNTGDGAPYFEVGPLARILLQKEDK